MKTRHVLLGAALLGGCMGQIGDGPPPTTPEDPGAGAAAGGAGGRSAPVALPAGTAPLPALVRRLTKDEYAYTVQDVLGVKLDATLLALLPDERNAEGFVNIAESQTVGAAQA